jgi:hypothetical protein
VELEDKKHVEVAAATPTPLGHLALRSATSSTGNHRAEVASGADLLNAATISIGDKEMAYSHLAA